MSYHTLEETEANGNSLIDGALTKDQALKKKGHGPVFGLLLALLAISFFLAGRNSKRIGAGLRGVGPAAFLAKNDSSGCNPSIILDSCFLPNTLECTNALCHDYGPICFNACRGMESIQCDGALQRFDASCYN